MNTEMFVTRLEFMEYKEHQETKYEILCEKINDQGKSLRNAVYFTGALISIITLVSMYLSFIGVI